ncbi:MAG: hypothetical protein NTU94_13070 [Planctomycetota bacterium]|nr:hypothetical protein [Planctomycetota bacterium]
MRNEIVTVTPDELGEQLRHGSETERMELLNRLGNQVLRVESDPAWPPDLVALAIKHNERSDALAAGWEKYDRGLQGLPAMMKTPAMKGRLVRAAAAALRAAKYDLLQTWIDVLRSRQRVLVKVIEFLEVRSTAAAGELAKRQEAAAKKLRAAGLGASEDAQVSLNQVAAERRFTQRVNEVPVVREARLAVETLRVALDAARGQINHVDQDVGRIGMLLVQAWADLTRIVP